MSFKTFGISNVEVIAPDSENTVISENIMKKYIDKYTKIIVLFDNDEPGIEAAKTYKKRYGFDYIILPFEKDISDTVKARGLEDTRYIVFESIKTLL
jgi:DNA primase